MNIQFVHHLYLLGLSVFLVLVCVQCTEPKADLFEQHYTAPEALTEESQVGDALFQQGMAAYRAGEHLVAVSFFLQADPTSVGFDTVSYYIGASELGLENYSRALGFLEAAEAVANDDIRADLLWYAALVEIKLSRKALARQTLEKLRSLEEHPYADRVEKLISEIGD